MAKVKSKGTAKVKIEAISRASRKAERLRVGFAENATYPDGTLVALVAAFNEYGVPSRGQPPRPFFRNMIAAKKNEWPKAIADLLKINNYDSKKTLEQAGLAISGQLVESINELVSPPLAASTIKRKGFDKPLIDTTQMRNSVTFEVK